MQGCINAKLQELRNVRILVCRGPNRPQTADHVVHVDSLTFRHYDSRTQRPCDSKTQKL